MDVGRAHSRGRATLPAAVSPDPFVEPTTKRIDADVALPFPDHLSTDLDPLPELVRSGPPCPVGREARCDGRAVRGVGEFDGAADLRRAFSHRRDADAGHPGIGDAASVADDQHEVAIVVFEFEPCVVAAAVASCVRDRLRAPR